MDWRNIPSLAALRAFEAAARLNSLSAAARELNVTHAAIAQHVRTLEAEFSQSLLFRQGNKMALTEAGKYLSDALLAGFTTIESGVSGLRKFGQDHPVSVSVTPSFAENWLMPRLGGFWTDHPDIRLNIIPSMELADLQADGIDLAIRYGNGDWPGPNTERLTSASYIVVGCPSLVAGHETDDLRDLQGLPWLTEIRRREQEVWAEANGLCFSQANVTEFPTGSLVLSAVRAGIGISILPKALVEHDIEDGRLLPIFEADIEGLAYYLVTRPNHMPAPLRSFIAWLRCCA